MKPTTHNKNSSELVNGVNKDVAVRRFQEFLLPVWMQPAKRPEGEIGSLATTLLASSKNGEKTPTDLQKYCTLLNVSEISIFHNWNHTFIFYSWWGSPLHSLDVILRYMARWLLGIWGFYVVWECDQKISQLRFTRGPHEPTALTFHAQSTVLQQLRLLC